MSVTVTNVGNGEILDDGILSYSYSEEVTSLDPSQSKGGTGQLNLRVRETSVDKDGNTHPNTKLMINNTIVMSDSDLGSVELQVKSISTNAGVANVTGNTAQWRLNVTRTAGPHGGDGATFATAIYYYCDLVGIIPTIDPALVAELDLIPVNFIGWNGNVWEYLKMLCSASVIPIEMYIDIDGLHFRRALDRENQNTEFAADFSISVDANDAAKEVGVYRYNTSYGVDKVVYEQSNYEQTGDPATKFLASIGDALQVDAGETIVKRFNIDATLEYVNQPVCVDTITRIPPAPYAGTTGEYVIVGTDGLPILPSQWNGLGGSVTITLTENPGEIEITIVAPVVDELTKVDSGIAYAPYKIGTEVADDAEYPAFWITGTGVFFDKRLSKFLTGAPDAYAAKDEAPTIDNPFITTVEALASRGTVAAQSICGPVITVSTGAATADGFGQAIGLTQNFESNKFRIESANYTESNVSMTGATCAVASDFDVIWTGKTFADFTAIAIDGSELAPYADQALKFNEFTVIPLMRAE
jgi:hypothetical protein